MIMEFKLFHSRSVSVSKIVCSGRTTPNQSYSRSWSGVGSCIQFEKRFCYCKGILLKASYSIAGKSKQSIDWVGQDKFTVGNGSSWIMETNGAISSLSLAERKILDASEDDYNGIVIDPERLPSSPEAFSVVLLSSLSHWRAMGKKGIWLKLPVERSELVPIAVKEGFQYHHAEHEYLMMTYWLPNEPCLLPANASHHVGVGGFVINNKDEVLVVLEKQPATPSCVGLWKIPTGFVQESEEIFTGAVREVKEETGIDTEFVEVVAFRDIVAQRAFPSKLGSFNPPKADGSICFYFLNVGPEGSSTVEVWVCFNKSDTQEVDVSSASTLLRDPFSSVVDGTSVFFLHAHRVAFEKSDLFFICMLQPLSTQIQVDDLEILDAKWMPLNEFVQQPQIKGDNMFKKIIEICIARLGKRYCGLSCHQVISKFDGKSSSLYYNVVEAEDDYCEGT